MSKLGTITRRTFFVTSTAVVGGALFGTYKYKQPVPNPLLDGDDAIDPDFASPNPYIKIDKDGVTVITPRAEMGQGVHSTLAMMVAEELDLDWRTIKTEHGPASNSYYMSIMIEAMVGHQYDHSTSTQFKRRLTHIPAKFLGIQMTGGSMSTPDGFVKMRSAGASARLVLIQAAAIEWSVDPDSLTTEDGFVINPVNNEKLAYTALAVKAAEIDAPSHPPLRDPSRWRYIGKSVPRVDIPAKVDGTAEFAIDVKLEGMLHATIKMSPRFGAGIKSSDTSKAAAMPGVEKIITLKNEGFAVIANNTWRAFKAANAISVEWETASYPAEQAGIMKAYEASFNSEPNGKFDVKGDIDLYFADVGDFIEAEYRVPHLAHSTMEPMTAVAQVKDGRVDIWAGNQAPVVIRDAIMKIGDYKASDVHIHTTFLGGGFGRRAESDFTLAAYNIAAQTDGRPVKVTWSREEDIQHDFYRPAAIARFKGVMGEKKPAAIDVQIASPSIMLSMSKRGPIPAIGPDKLIAEGTAGQPDDIDHMRIQTFAPKLDIPVGFWRSVGASFNGFLHESFMDELAASKNIDPIAMRLEMFGDLAPPGNKVVEKVAQMAQWNGREGINGTDNDRGRGFAYTLSFGAHTAQIIDVSMTKQGIKIDKIYCAVDVGVAIDPRNIEAQIQSGIIYGLSSAMTGEITFADGKVVQSNYHDYPAMRIHQVPEIEVTILENNPQITGVGEPGTPPSIPALANAIFALTGQRIRELPMNKHVEFV